MYSDKKIIKELAKQYQELALHEVNEKRLQRMYTINDLKLVRPTVLIDEIPWHELNVDNQLTLMCQDEFARKLEWFFKTTLFRWKYFQADMVVENAFYIYKHYTSTGLGICVQENTISVDKTNNIVSHCYQDQLDTEEKLEQLANPVISADKEQDNLDMQRANELLDGILTVKLKGHYCGFVPWDQISELRGVEAIYMDLADRPEFMHKIIARFTEIGLSRMRQMEEQDLLESRVTNLHCTSGLVSDLPSKEFDGKRVKLKDTWFRGAAQLFAYVSPQMHKEFELDYMEKLFDQCGLVYYGCCEPLDNKISLLKQYKNMRKISVSPWANIRSCAEQIGNSYVYSRKPNPAMVAGQFDKQAVIAETEETIKACMQHHCPYEFILKDISTTSYKLNNLVEWNKTVMETIDQYYK